MHTNMNFESGKWARLLSIMQNLNLAEKGKWNSIYFSLLYTWGRYVALWLNRTYLHIYIW